MRILESDDQRYYPFVTPRNYRRPPAQEINMEPYQQRVIDEKAELDEKLAKLRAFTEDTEKFTRLDKNEQERMTRQKSYMAEYSRVLGERIAAFK
jgi:hypothetical protein